MFKFSKKTVLGLIVIFIIAIITKIFQYTMLPIKYFYDSSLILELMNGNYIADKAYNSTAYFFDSINFFGFNSLFQWSIFLGIVFNILIVLILLLRYKSYELGEYIFIYGTAVLLNIYVFNLSKDMIQFLSFAIIYIILCNRNIKDNYKIAIITLILILISIFFRIYYAIMAMVLLDIYFIYYFKIFNKTSIKGKKMKVKIIINSLIVFFIEIFLISIITKSNYNSIVFARSSVNIYRETSTDAVTIINDIFKSNGNYIIFILNYIVNFFRMAFPIELIAKGIKYIPFIVYQIYISYKLIDSFKNNNGKYILFSFVYLAYFMMSVIFEPDFGSFIRHETAISFIILEIIRTQGIKRKE